MLPTLSANHGSLESRRLIALSSCCFVSVTSARPLTQRHLAQSRRANNDIGLEYPPCAFGHQNNIFISFWDLYQKFLSLNTQFVLRRSDGDIQSGANGAQHMYFNDNVTPGPFSRQTQARAPSPLAGRASLPSSIVSVSQASLQADCDPANSHRQGWRLEASLPAGASRLPCWILSC